VELQDFALLRLYTRLLFSQNQGTVLDKRGETAQAMAEHLQIDGVSILPTAAEVESEDRRDRFRIGVAQTYAMIGNFDKIDEAVDRARRFFEMAFELLGSPGIRALNVHTVAVAPADSFELVRDRLADRLLGSAASELGSAVGSPLRDMGWSAEFEDLNRKITVRLGPMQNEQLGELLQEQDPDSPPNMLFLDVDSDVQLGERGTGHAIESWAKAVESHRDMTTRIGDWLKEMLD
jgi:hypothetical protein